MLKLCRLMSMVLVAGQGRRIQPRKGPTQGPFHQSLVPIDQVGSEKKIFNDFFLPNFFYLGWRPWSLDKILKGNHPRTIPVKFRPNLPSGFRGLKWEKLTTDRRRRLHGDKSLHDPFGSGELKMRPAGVGHNRCVVLQCIE